MSPAVIHRIAPSDAGRICGHGGKKNDDAQYHPREDEAGDQRCGEFYEEYPSQILAGLWRNRLVREHRRAEDEMPHDQPNPDAEPECLNGDGNAEKPLETLIGQVKRIVLSQLI